MITFTHTCSFLMFMSSQISDLTDLYGCSFSLFCTEGGDVCALPWKPRFRLTLSKLELVHPTFKSQSRAKTLNLQCRTDCSVQTVRAFISILNILGANVVECAVFGCEPDLGPYLQYLPNKTSVSLNDYCNILADMYVSQPLNARHCQL